MQGFLNTTAGVRPILLDGIESVTYTTATGGLRGTGTLAIKYIPNAGITSGNVFVNIPAYDDNNYPIEAFWNWVASVAAGSQKPYNSFLGTGVVCGAVVGAVVQSYSSTDGYVIKVADDLPLDPDICAMIFDTNATVQGVIDVPNYTNVMTNNSSSTTPTFADHVYVGTQQGFTVGHAEVAVDNQTLPSNNNAVLTDGTYAWLEGVPQHEELGTTIPQSGTIHRVSMKNGIIIGVETCPQNFQFMGLKGWIRKNSGEPQNLDCDHQCAQIALNAGCSLTEADWNLGLIVDEVWVPIEVAFDGIPVPFFDLNEGGYSCTFGSAANEQTMYIPNGTSIWIKGFHDTAYVPATSGETITTEPNATAQLGTLMDYIALFTVNSYDTNPNHVLSIDYGMTYPDPENAPLSCAYFKADSFLLGTTLPTDFTFSQFNRNWAAEVSGYADFPCITLAGGGGPS